MREINGRQQSTYWDNSGPWYDSFIYAIRRWFAADRGSYPESNYAGVTLAKGDSAASSRARQPAICGFNSTRGEQGGRRRIISRFYSREPTFVYVDRRQVRVGFVSKAISVFRRVCHDRAADDDSWQNKLQIGRKRPSAVHSRLSRDARAIHSCESQINGGHNFGRWWCIDDKCNGGVAAPPIIHGMLARSLNRRKDAEGCFKKHRLNLIEMQYCTK